MTAIYENKVFLMSKTCGLKNKKAIDLLADQCVKCGLCLPYCPTYQLTEDENESPRGRIAIMQGLARQELEPTKKVVDHLEHCLSCRHCERVCPAHVQYGELITHTRIALQQHPSKTIKLKFKTRMLTKIVQSQKSIQRIGLGLRLIDRLGLRHFARWTFLTKILGLSAMDKLLPPVPSQKKFKALYPSSHKQGSVALFLGCLSRWCDREVFEASIYALNEFGYDVHIPSNQGCCGAMAMHQGLEQQAKELFAQNATAFESIAIDKIISTASGCGSMLQEAKIYMPEDKYQVFSNKVTDVSHFIAQNLQGHKLTNLDLKVALHTPCTLQNCMKESDAAKQLLKSIPGLQSFDITEKDTCCGSAGSYMIENPEWANALVDKILTELDTSVDFIATSNIGCALHLRRALKQRKATD